ncbi:putative F-box domain-containing protein [Medicago truncatula]|uniref:F-box/RNI/FBD-like domain protein n=1 Tax=Medicago truncatula TaxID=3880 RepID=G7JAY6_MEDTR|nr:F-box/RNI/FBD-like domain protein [Medicago truncatula]RHN69895.1 putative F-box domain-containing protein [Medicago truncatula]
MSPKKKKWSKLEDSTAVDRFSELPDEILCHILSFIPTIFALTTTVLSKRWTPLFYSLAVLRFRFNHETVRNHNSFNHLCRFIDTLMLSPRVSNQTIKTFSLNCCFLLRKFNSPSPSNVSAWVEAAAPKLRHVEKFVLILKYSITLNPIILISRTLVILKLEQLKIQSDNLCVDLP